MWNLIVHGYLMVLNALISINRGRVFGMTKAQSVK